MKAIIQLAPLGVAILVFALIVGYLIQHQNAIGVWLFAAFLVGHGLVHIMFAAPPPSGPGSPGAEFVFDPSRSWLVTARLLDVNIVRVLVVALVALTVAGYALAGLATVGLLVSRDLWPALMIGATVASLGLMAVAVMPGLVLGVVIDVALLAIVVFSVWAPGRAAVS
jgi:hypothetical protein